MNLFTGLPSTLRTNYRRDMQLLDSGFVRFWAVAGLAAVLLLPLALTNFWTGIANQSFIAIIGALALNLLMGTTGQISLGACRIHRRRRFHGRSIGHACRCAVRGDAARGCGRRRNIGRCGRSSGLAAQGSLSRRQHARRLFRDHRRYRPIPGCDQLRGRIHHAAGGSVRSRYRIRARVVLCSASGHARNHALERELAAIGLRQSLDGDPPS